MWKLTQKTVVLNRVKFFYVQRATLFVLGNYIIPQEPHYTDDLESVS